MWNFLGVVYESGKECEYYVLPCNNFNSFNPLPEDKILDWSKLKQIGDVI